MHFERYNIRIVEIGKDCCNMKDRSENSKGKIFTLPNILSYFRLCLIPLIVWLYCVKEDELLTTVFLALSGLTDVVDGIIARKFHMVSDLGKALDPVADKLTQIAMLFCLVTRFPLMLLPLILLVIKEIVAATLNLAVIRRTGVVKGAVWHGKVNTVLLYAMMLIHLVWYHIPAVVSNLMIAVCTAMMLLSCVLYSVKNIKVLAEHRAKQ